MKTWVIFILVLVLLPGCTKVGTEDMLGLWELNEVLVDAMPREHGATFVNILSDNRLAVSRTSGDIIGFYRLENSKLRTRSEGDKWFNTTWEVEYFEDHFLLHGLDTGFRTTRLKFVRIEKIPDFEEYVQAVTGKWQLYKIRTGEGVENLSDTWVVLEDDGTYYIENKDGMVETGTAVINPRHKKIIFQQQETVWDTWFYGKELRLSNRESETQFSMRRVTNNDR